MHFKISSQSLIVSHSLFHSRTYSLSYLLTNSPIHPPTYPSTHSLTCSHILSPTWWNDNLVAFHWQAIFFLCRMSSRSYRNFLPGLNVGPQESNIRSASGHGRRRGSNTARVFAPVGVLGQEWYHWAMLSSVCFVRFYRLAILSIRFFLGLSLVIGY